MKKRGMSVPFIEEGRQTSFIGGSVSPEWCHRGQHRINHPSLTHLLSSSFSLPSSWLSLSTPHPPLPFTFLASFLCLHPSHERWSLPSQPIKLTAIFVAVADPESLTFSGKMSFIMAVMSLYLLPGGAAQMAARTPTCTRAGQDLHCRHMPRHDRLPLTFGLYDSLLHRLHLKWSFRALKTFIRFNSIKLLQSQLH